MFVACKYHVDMSMWPCWGKTIPPAKDYPYKEYIVAKQLIIRQPSRKARLALSITYKSPSHLIHSIDKHAYKSENLM